MKYFIIKSFRLQFKNLSFFLKNLGIILNTFIKSISMKIQLYYDKDCPFCNYYSNYLKLKQEHKLILLNARDSDKEIDEFRVLGFDINNGFIIKLDDSTIYQGADAIIFLNDLAEKKIFFLDNHFFRNLVYPFIKQLRKILLFILGKKSKI